MAHITAHWHTPHWSASATILSMTVPTDDSPLTLFLGLPFALLIVALLVKAMGGMEWTYNNKIQPLPPIRHGNVRIPPKVRGHDEIRVD